MDEGLRRSVRSVKIRKDPSFLYDEDIVNLLEENGSRGRKRHHRLTTTTTSISEGTRPIPSIVSPRAATNSFGKNVANDSLDDCSDIYYMPFASNCVENNTQQVDSNSPIKLRGSISQQYKLEPEDRRQEGDLSSVCLPSDFEVQEKTVFRKISEVSSSRLDFLNFEGHILFVS